MRLSVSVPGKVVLLGEYSVLEGGPALAMAVNKRTTVTLADNGLGHCRVHSHDKSLRTAAFDLSTTGQIRWLDNTSDLTHTNYTLLDAVTETLSEYGLVTNETAPSLDVHLDSDDFFYSHDADQRIPRQKLGLGSSAALVVALGTALCAYSSHSERSATEWTRILLTAHRKFQGNAGSGVDVATSVNGGIITYRLIEDRPDVHKIALPPTLDYRFVWTGKSASTPEFLQKLGLWASAHPIEYAAIMRELRELAEEGIADIETHDAIRLLENTNRFNKCVIKFSKLTGLEIYTHHGDINMVAKSVGVLYKPCGAGGGDLGVAMSSDSERLNDFATRVKQLNYPIVPLCVDLKGPIRTCIGVS